MKVQRVAHVKDSAGKTESEEVTLQAVYGDSEENKRWSKWTPSANFTIHINNPAAIGKLSNGHEYYVDFTPVKEPDHA
jgi:hypothetical protein